MAKTPGQVAYGGGEIDVVAVAPLRRFADVEGGKAALIERQQAPYLKSPIWIVGSRFPSIRYDATVFAAWKEPFGETQCSGVWNMSWVVRPMLYRAVATRLFVHSAMPKSASSYLKSAMEKASRRGGRFVHPKCSLGYGHNFYDRRKIPWFPRSGRTFRFYGHTPLSKHNHAIMRAIDPNFIAVVSIRPLPDIVVSYADQIEKKGTGALDTRMASSIEGYRFYAALSDEEKYQYLIDYVMPWYSRYMVSWLNFNNDKRVKIIKYDDISKDIQNVLDCIFRFAGDAGMNFEFERNVDLDFKARYNRGISGRGLQLLSAGQITQLKAQAKIVRQYPQGPEIYRYLIEGEA